MQSRHTNLGSTYSQSYDYIVVGAGTCGCIVANRLTEDPNINVLLIEAGGNDDDPKLSETSLSALFSVWKTDMMWAGLATEPEPGLNMRSMNIIQAKLMGGGSSNNGRIYLRGNRKDYDLWGYLGNEGWDYEGCLPYWKKLEDWEGGADAYHGSGGPVHVITTPDATNASQAFVEAGPELGFKNPNGNGEKWDFNGFQQEGVASYTHSTTTVDNKRASTAAMYIRPVINRPNLTVAMNCQTTRVLMHGTNAVGVEYISDNNSNLIKVEAKKEVILSAGALSTPKLLMLSGIGPSDHLKDHGIHTLVNLPGVGQNVQDHLFTMAGCYVNVEQHEPSIICEASFFTRTRSGLYSPDLQYFFSGFFSPDFPNPPTRAGFTMSTVLSKPQSRGEVSLRSNNPLDLPRVRMNYLSTEYDMQQQLYGFALRQEFLNTPALSKIITEDVTPGPDGKDEKSLRDYIRNTTNTDWHPSCSCRMGYDELGVVDTQLRVHGTTGLRIIDASIMPEMPNCNINAACLMIGEKGSSLVKGLDPIQNVQADKVYMDIKS